MSRGSCVTKLQLQYKAATLKAFFFYRVSIVRAVALKNYSSQSNQYFSDIHSTFELSRLCITV